MQWLTYHLHRALAGNSFPWKPTLVFIIMLDFGIWYLTLTFVHQINSISYQSTRTKDTVLNEEMFPCNSHTPVFNNSTPSVTLFFLKRS